MSRIEISTNNKNTNTKKTYLTKEPLSHLQRGILFQNTLATHQPLYLLQTYIRLTGELKQSLYKKAWRYLVDQYPNLRTGITYTEGEPEQFVADKVTLPITVYDYTQVNCRDTQLNSYLLEDRQKAFSLSAPPLIRIALLQWSAEEHHTVLTCHHLLLDGYSILRLFDEVISLYEALLKKKEIHLKKQGVTKKNSGVILPPIDSPVVIPAHLKLSQSSQLALPQQTNAQITAQIKRRTITVPPSLYRQLKQQCQKNRYPISVLIYAGWGLLLRHYCQQDTVCFGVIRQIPKLERREKYGLFINVLPLSFHFSKEITCQDYLNTCYERCKLFKKYAHIPLSQWFLTTNDQSPHQKAGFDTAVNVMSPAPNYFAQQIQHSSLQFDQANFFVDTEHTIMLDALLDPQEMTLRMNYNTCYVTEELSEQILHQLLEILKQLARPSKSCVYPPTVLRSIDQHNVLVHWNQTTAAYPKQLTLIDLFEQQCHRTPHLTAVVDSHQHEILTFKELDEASNQLANLLITKGLQQHHLVGLCLPRSLNTIKALLAILKVGARYLPLDPSYPDQRLQYLLKDSLCHSVILTPDETQRFLPWVKQRDAATPLVLWDIETLTKEAQHVSSVFSSRARSTDDLSVIYTSGSTGKPKGVCNRHQGATNRVFWMQTRFPLASKDAVLQKTPLHFDVSVWEIFWPLISGARLVLGPTECQHSVEVLWNTIQEQRITTLHFVPSLFTVFLQHPKASECHSIQRIFASGEVLPWDTQQRCFHELPNVELYNLYGPTEASVDVTYWPCRPHPLLPRVPIGYPISNTQLYILDAQQRPVSAGIIGELYIGGEGLASGYAQHPELTEQRFVNVQLTENNSQRLYKTGDLAAWRFDGSIDYIGRNDQQVKLRGYRIELGEIEAQLSSLPAISACVVVLCQTPSGQDGLVAYVVVTPPQRQRITIKEMESQLSSFLPEYMCPFHWVMMESLPKLPNGKVDRRALPPPNWANPRGEVTLTSESTDLIPVLRTVWQSVLNTTPIHNDDSFFALGGDSITTMQISLQMQRYGFTVKPQHLFEYPTIRQLANWLAIQKSQKEQPHELPEKYPVSPIQAKFLANQEKETRNYWHQILVWRCRAPLSTQRLTRAWQAVLAHHPVFSYAFFKEGNTWQMERKTQPLVLIERYPLTTAPQNSLYNDPYLRQQHQQIDLHKGPLARIILIESHFEQVIYCYSVVHHLIIDAISWPILCDQVALAYEQLEQGQAVFLPKATVNYFAWIQQQNQSAADAHSSSDSIGKKSLFPATRVPTSVTINNRVCESQLETKYLSIDSSQRLEKWLHTLQIDRRSLLLYALAITLFSQTNEQELEIVIEKNGRDDQTNIASSIGWFTQFCTIKIEKKALIGQLRITLKKIEKSLANTVPFLPSMKTESLICLNDLGNLDRWSHYSSLFDLVYDPHVPTRHPNSVRPFWIDIESFIQEKQWHIAWRYPKELLSFFDARQCFTKYLDTLTHFAKELQDTTQFSFHDLGGGFLSSFQKEQLKKTWEKWKTQYFFSEGNEIENTYPLTLLQKSMVYHTLQQKAACYTSQALFTVSGAIDIQRFQEVWQHFIDVHETFRSALIAADSHEPMRVILKNIPFKVRFFDLSSLNPKQRTKKIEEDSLVLRKQGIQLNGLPLFDVALFKQTNQLHTMVFTYHHIILDGWSVSRVIQSLFSALSPTSPHRVVAEETSFSFSDYWEYTKRQPSETSKKYWNTLLAGMETSPSFLLAKTSTTDQINKKKTHYETQSFSFDADLSEKIKQESKQLNITPNMIFQAAWALLLNHYTQTSDVVFGTTTSGRSVPIPQIETALGLFIKTFPVRIQFTSKTTLLDLIQTLYQQISQGITHSDYPLEDLSKDTSNRKTPTSLFNSLLVYENYPLDFDQEKTALKVIDYRSYDPTHYPLSILIFPRQRFELFITYDTRAWNHQQIKNLYSHFLSLSKQILNHPGTPLLSTTLFDSSNCLNDSIWNQTQFQYPQNKGIHQLFEEKAIEIPHQIAVIDKDKQLTYQQLNRTANQFARYLQTLGVKLGTRVLIAMSHRTESLISLLSILKTGATYVPVSIDFPTKRIQYIIDRCQAHHLITDAIEENSTLENVNITHQIQWGKTLQETIDQQADSNLSIPHDKNNSCYIIFTSGSTGKPKGVVIKHQALTNVITAFTKKLTGTIRFLAFTDLSFDVAALERFYPLVTGGTCVFTPSLQHNTAKNIHAVIRQKGVTHLQTTPSILRYLLKNGLDLSQLTVLSGGETLESSLAKKLMECCKAVWNLYGPTETTLWSTAHHCQETETQEPTMPIGKPLQNTKIYVLDPYQREVPPDFIGDIYIAGDGLAKGYLRDSNKTKSVFQIHTLPNGTQETRYFTGDLGYWRSDGVLVYVGRKDHQIKYHGVRIELNEIETVLQQHPIVQQAVVTLQEHTDGHSLLSAFVVPKESVHTHTLFDGIRQDILRDWQRVYETIYQTTPQQQPFSFDTRGWHSSYDQKPFSRETMEDWVQQTVYEIQRLKPQRILELGCGTGLLLMQLAPNVEQYIATDFSDTVLAALADKIKNTAYKDKVHLINSTAGGCDYSQYTYDTVLLNSVIQYFPDATHLNRVLSSALEHLKTSGAFFIGDVESLAHRDLYYLSIEMKNKNTLSVQEMLENLASRRAYEKELLVSPSFFVDFAQQHPHITHVDIHLKNSRFQNEMSSYRYNVILYTNREEASKTTVHWQSWKTIENDNELETLLKKKPRYIALKAIPNERWYPITLLNTLNERPLLTDKISVKKIKSTNTNWITQEKLHNQAEQHGYLLKLTINEKQPLSHYDALFYKEEDIDLYLASLIKTTQKTQNKQVHPETNLPSYYLYKKKIEEILRNELQTQLPPSMIPSLFEIIDKIPLTVNGKIDRKKLSQISHPKNLKATSLRSPTEMTLSQIWASLLNLDSIAPEDHFFEIGGHSLLALQLISEIETHYQVTVTLSELFHFSTLRQLAQLIEQRKENNKKSDKKPPEFDIKHALITLQSQGDQAPLFLIHPIGGTVFCYYALSQALGTDQPLFAIEDPGIHIRPVPFNSIESMATSYLHLVREKQPNGPYVLGGASLGGLIAFEMGRQLEKESREQAIILLIDTWAKPSERMNDPQRLKETLLRQYKMTKENLKQYNIPNPMPWLTLHKQRIRLINDYHPPRVNYPIYLFKSATLMPDFQSLDDKENYWAPHAPHLTTEVVPGDHETILLPNNARLLANKIKQAIKNAIYSTRK